MRLLTVLSTLLVTAAAHAAPLDLTSASVRELGQAMEAGRLDSEMLVMQALARIEAYDDAGPTINAVLHVNENALAEARALDNERARSGPRSPWHGIPVLLKDNIDTADMPTTAGSFLLAGTMPPDDAFLTRRLREAGAIVLGKVNLSEFASGGPLSSLGGPTFNPHDPARSPAGSSGGSGASVAAAYAPLALGTDTGGSVRGPSSANGIVGLKPTLGLLSRDGIVPLALSFDTAGPMTRSVEDLALSLNVLAAVDDADPATAAAAEHITPDYTAFLDANALADARIGIARDFMGADQEVDWHVEAALETFREAGAEVVDVHLPPWLLEVRGDFYRTIRFPEFRAQIAEYLQARDPNGPQSLGDLIAGARTLRARRADGAAPDPSRWSLMLRENEASDLDHPEYRAMHEHGLPLVRAVLQGVFDSESLDAIVYPTSPTRPSRIDPDPRPGSGPGGGGSAVILANMSGFPDLIVPAGFTGYGLPVTLSFLGPAFSEPRLIALGYAFEQRAQARRLPITTPPLPGDLIEH